jgi:hypothetical protein
MRCLVLNHQILRYYVRTRLKTLVVCDTGVTNLGTDVNGFTRAAGSFKTDGFAPGMELASTGFTGGNNGNFVVRGVADTNLYVDGGLVPTGVVAGRRLVVGLPAQRFWENRNTDQNAQPISGRPYVEEEYLPGTSKLRSMASSGVVESYPVYVLRWYGVSDRGTRDLDTCIDKLLRLFPAGFGFTLSDGAVVHVAEQGPMRTQPKPEKSGWEVVTVSLFLWSLTNNPVAT